MKRTLIIIAALLILASCGSKEKEALKNTIPQEMGYKYKDHRIVQTLTNKDVADSIRDHYAVTEKEPLEEFKEKRNREFEVFRYMEPNYEEDVMRGSLKDASEWCTEIREITELADSLIAVYDKVSGDDWAYNRFQAWYLARGAKYFGWSDADKWKEYSLAVKNDKKGFELLKKVAAADPNGVYGYRVIHDYTVKNPILENGDRIIMQDAVTVDKDWNVVEFHHTKSPLMP